MVIRWRIGEILIQKKLITWDELGDGLKEQTKTREFIGEILVRKGRISKSLLYRGLAEQFNMKYVDLRRTMVNDKALACMPKSIAEKYNIFPLEMQDNMLIMALSDPLQAWPEDDVRNLAQVKSIQKVLSLPEDVKNAIGEYYPDESPE